MVIQLRKMILSVLIIKNEFAKAIGLSKYLETQFPEMRFQAASIEEGISILKNQSVQILITDLILLKSNSLNLWKHFPNPQFDLLCTGKNAQQTALALNFFINSSNELLNSSFSGEEKIPRPLLNNTIALPNSNGFHYINIYQILYCQASRNYTELYLLNGKKMIISKNIKFIEKALHDYPFLRISKSHLINLREVQAFSRKDGGFVMLSNETTVAVSNRHKDKLLYLLNTKVG